VAGFPLPAFLCHTASLASFGIRITAFLEERLIGSAERKLLPAVAACNLHIAGHSSPCKGIVPPDAQISYKECYEKRET
jgi:hypothetical protein